MKRLKKALKMVGWSLLILLVVAVIGGLLFLNLNPQFGGSVTKKSKEQFEILAHYDDGEFQNLIPTSMDLGFSGMMGTLYKFITGVPNSRPDFELPVQKVDSTDVAGYKGSARLTWFGHSAFLLEIDGKNILIDPMLGKSPSPLPFFGSKRYSDNLPIAIEKLPKIDAIIISHDHYDHLDYGSIRKLKGKTRQFFVPLGVGAHFESWDIDSSAIHELDWWDETNFEGIELAFAPSRHFSGRGLTDRNSTLWGSWIIKGKSENIYFSGDGGFGPHFKEIGEKYGPFDFAMIECGQYNKNWEQIHMMPEQSAQAAINVKAKIMMPIHWGAFTLALHSWTDPVVRVSAEAKRLNMPLVASEIGSAIVISELPKDCGEWWKKRN